MYKKSIFTSIILSLSVAFSYFLVFTWTWAFDSSVKISFKLTDTIYLDSSGLNYNKIMFKYKTYHNICLILLNFDCLIWLDFA